MGATDRPEGRSPAFLAEARELEVESLAGHAGGDEADARPPVEPALAFGQSRGGAGGRREAGGGEGRDEQPASLGEIERGTLVHRSRSPADARRRRIDDEVAHRRAEALAESGAHLVEDNLCQAGPALRQALRDQEHGAGLRVDQSVAGLAPHELAGEDRRARGVSPELFHPDPDGSLAIWLGSGDYALLGSTYLQTSGAPPYEVVALFRVPAQPVAAYLGDLNLTTESHEGGHLSHGELGEISVTLLPIDIARVTLEQRLGTLPEAPALSPWCAGDQLPGFNDPKLATRARELLDRGCPAA